MIESEKLKASSEADIFPQSAVGPLVFIATTREAQSSLRRSASYSRVSAPG
jgi:hypothetical protein